MFVKFCLQISFYFNAQKYLKEAIRNIYCALAKQILMEFEKKKSDFHNFSFASLAD
jgi:hypothetical protein